MDLSMRNTFVKYTQIILVILFVYFTFTLGSKIFRNFSCSLNNSLCVIVETNITNVVEPENLEYTNVKLNVPSDIVYIYKNTENRSVDKTLDIVFFNNGFQNNNDFINYVKSISSAIRNYDYFNTNLGKFNIGYVSKILDKNLYQCNDYQCTNDQEIDKIKNQYADVAIILSNSDKFSGWSFFTDKWPNYLGYVNISKGIFTSYPYSAVVHELGHSLAKLNDEYVYTNSPSLTKVDGVNCKSSCNKLQTNSCYKGCSFDDFFRGSPASVMKDPKSTYFDSVAKNQLVKMMQVYAPKIYIGATTFTISESKVTPKFTINWDGGDVRPHLIYIGSQYGANEYFNSGVMYSGSNYSIDLTSVLSKKPKYIYIRFFTWDSASAKWLYSDKRIQINY